MESTNNFVPPVNSVPPIRTPFTPPPPVTPPIPPLAPPQPPVYPRGPVIQPSQPKKHWIAKVIILVVLLLIGGLAVYAQSLGMFSSSQRVVKNAVLSMDGIKTFSSDIDIPIKYSTQSGTQTASIKFVIDGDKSDKDNLKMSGKISFTGMGLTGNMDIKSIGKTVYFKINEFPMLTASPVQVLGTWFSLSEEDARKLSELYGRTLPTTGVLNTENQITSKEVYTIIEEAGMLDSITSFGLSSKNGTYVRSYKVTVNNESIKKFIASVYKLSNEKIGTTTSPLSEEEINKSIDLLLGQISFDPIIVDVGVTDGLLHGFQSGISLRPDSSIPAAGGLMDAHIGLNVLYSKFDENIVIEAPLDSKSLLKMVEESLSSAREKGRDAAVKANISSVRAYAEIYYDKGSTYSGLCTKDSNIKATSVELAKAERSGIAPTCIATAKAYSYASRLTDKTYYCVDSTGASKVIPGKPVTTSCK